jgi:hypothetical protein
MTTSSRPRPPRTTIASRFATRRAVRSKTLMRPKGAPQSAPYLCC